MKQRAQFTTKIGILAATVGSAVGLGNIWRFPYEAGSNGGAAFIFIYIISVCVIGIPVICCEFIMGRGTHKNVHGAFNALHASSLWKYASYLNILASLMILSFYSVVAGWTLNYLSEAVTGKMTMTGEHDFSAEFGNFVASPWQPTVFTIIFLMFNHVIVARGIKKGIERISNTVMPILGVILIVLMANSLLLPKATEGLRFLFYPDFTKITPSVVLSALGQAFFSLSLGLSCLLTYSSYFNDRTPLVKNATMIATLDTIVAIISGIIIFCALFSFDGEPAAGPKLVFEILPGIFNSMPGGYFWAVLFFLLLVFASITSSISMTEISVAYFSEEYNISRKTSTRISTAIGMIFGALCSLSFGILNDFTIFGMSLFSLFDYISSNILLPLGGLIFTIFVGWIINKRFVQEQLTNNGQIARKSSKIIIFLIKYIAPIAIVVVCLSVLRVI
ncbi:MAG: sodium-dependent transporter [Muribaculaceae bacterium]|nr:sodium-dependent transporter [Muribaculaceae bacterium]